MAQFERFNDNRLGTTGPNLRPNIGGVLTGGDIASLTDTSSLQQAVRSTDQNLRQLRAAEERLRVQDANILAVEKSVKLRTSLIGLTDQVSQRALEKENHSNMIQEFQNGSGELVSQALEGIDDPDTATRVELALQRDLAIFSANIANQQIDLRKQINSKKFSRAIREADVTTRQAGNTDITLDTAQTLLGQLGIDQNIFDNATESKLRGSIEALVRGGAEALVIKDPDQALADLNGGRYDAFLKSGQVNDLVIQAMNKKGTNDRLGTYLADQQAANNISQLENTGQIVGPEPDFSVYPEKNNIRAAAMKDYEDNLVVARNVYQHTTNIKSTPLGTHNLYIQDLRNTAKTAADFKIVNKLEAFSAQIFSAYTANSKAASLKYSDQVRSAARLLTEGEISQQDFNSTLYKYQDTIGAPKRLFTNSEAKALVDKFTELHHKENGEPSDTDEYIQLVKAFDNAHGEFTDDAMAELVTHGNFSPQVSIAMHYATIDNKEAVQRILTANQMSGKEGGFAELGISGDKKTSLEDAFRSNQDLREFIESSLGHNFIAAPGMASFAKTFHNVASSYMVQDNNITAGEAMNKTAGLLLSSYHKTEQENGPSIFTPRHIGRNGAELDGSYIDDGYKHLSTPEFYEDFGIDSFEGQTEQETYAIFAKKGYARATGDGETFLLEIKNDIGDFTVATKDGIPLQVRFDSMLSKGLVIEKTAPSISSNLASVGRQVERDIKDIKKNLDQRVNENISEDIRKKEESIRQQPKPLQKRIKPLTFRDFETEIGRLQSSAKQHNVIPRPLKDSHIKLVSNLQDMLEDESVNPLDKRRIQNVLIAIDQKLRLMEDNLRKDQIPMYLFNREEGLFTYLDSVNKAFKQDTKK